MSEEKLTREEFDKLQEEVLELATGLVEKDRHGRGGTTIGEAFASDAFAEGLIAALEDPLYIQYQVNRHLKWWCGERDVWAPSEGRLLQTGYGPPGIAMLSEQNRKDGRLPGPEEVALRASRAESMTERKAEPRIAALYEHAKLCLDLAEAFERRLEDESGIRLA